jgi:hypothetical protein
VSIVTMLIQVPAGNLLTKLLKGNNDTEPSKAGG